MVVGEAVLEVGEQLRELVEEVVGRRLAAVALEHVRRDRIGAGRAADPEVDPAGNSPLSRLKRSATFSGL